MKIALQNASQQNQVDLYVTLNKTHRNPIIDKYFIVQNATPQSFFYTHHIIIGILLWTACHQRRLLILLLLIPIFPHQVLKIPLSYFSFLFAESWRQQKSHYPLSYEYRSVVIIVAAVFYQYLLYHHHYGQLSSPQSTQHCITSFRAIAYGVNPLVVCCPRNDPELIRWTEPSNNRR